MVEEDLIELKISSIRGRDRSVYVEATQEEPKQVPTPDKNGDFNW